MRKVDVTTQLLIDWNDKNKPPLDTKEVLSTVNSAYNYPTVDTKTLFLYPSEMQELGSKGNNFGTTSEQHWGVNTTEESEVLKEADRLLLQNMKRQEMPK